MKKKKVALPVRVEAAANGYLVVAGRRPPLPAASRALAEAVAAAWRTATPRAKPENLPLVRLALAAAQLAETRDAVRAATLAYGETDLLCYRAGPGEDRLRARQAEVWGPWLEWAAARLGATLAVTEGIVHRPQPPGALAALSRAVTAASDSDLAALREAAGLTGSLVLALALVAGEITAAEASAVAQLDETAQAERWGRDGEAEAVMESRRAALETVAAFVRLARED